MPSASILIKPASSNCNLDCKYCFYKCLSSNREEYSKGFMKKETLELLIKNAIAYADDYLTFAFQGGEPMLAGIDFFETVVELEKQYGKEKKNLHIENTLQTNGCLITDEWAEFFAKNNFLIGVSLDGPKKIHDAGRRDCFGKETFHQVMTGIEILKNHQVAFNILTVVTEDSTSKASAIYSFFQRNGFEYVQLIPCMDEMNRQSLGKTSNPFAVNPISYGRFLSEFFDLWYEDFKRGNIMDVRMFSNLAQMSVGFPAEECGMCGKCKCYFVVEGDGSVYPCDFYCMDEYRLGTVATPFGELLKTKQAVSFEEVSCHKPEECLQCRYYNLCNGGCRRFREPFTDGKPGINYLCEGYKLFFEHTGERINRLGKTILNPENRKYL